MAHRSFSEATPLPGTFKELFEGRRARLEEMIDPNYGLLSLLRDKKVLNDRQLQSCKTACKNGTTVGVTEMLDILERCGKEKVKDFVDALHENDQSHIMDILRMPPESSNTRMHCRSNDSSPTCHLANATLSTPTKSPLKYLDTWNTQNNDSISNTHSSAVGLTAEHSAMVKRTPQRQCSYDHELYAKVSKTVFKGTKVSPVDLIRLFMEKRTEISKLEQRVVDYEIDAAQSEQKIWYLNQELATAREGHMENVAQLQRQLRTQKDKLEQVINEKTKAERRIDELVEILKLLIIKRKIYVRERTSKDMPSTLALTLIGHETLDATDRLHISVIEEVETYDQDINWVFPYEILEHILMKAVHLQIGHGNSVIECEDDLTVMLSVCAHWWYILTCRRFNRRQIRHILRVVAGSGYRDNVEQCSEYVRNLIESDYDLLDKLKIRHILTSDEFYELLSQESASERVEKLLDIMTSKVDEQYGKFVAVLRRHGQRHVANVLSTDSCTNNLDDLTLDTEFGDVRPLTKSILSFIDLNLASMSELLDPCSSFIEKLCCEGCINRLQTGRIESFRRREDKLLSLMAIMKRRSMVDYRKFVRCLEDSNQLELALAFRSEGAILPLNIEICTHFFRDSLLLSHSSFECAYKQSGLDERLGTESKLIFFKCHRNRITAYFLCCSVVALHQLDSLFTSGELSNMMYDVCNLVVDFQPLLETQMSMTLNPKVYINAVRHFHLKIGLLEALYQLTPPDCIHTCDFTQNFHWLVSRQLCFLVWQKILQKTAVLQCAEFAKVSSKPYVVVFLALGAVCREWWREMRRLGPTCRQIQVYRQPRLVKSVKAQGRVLAIAESNSRIFTVSRRSHTVQVFGKSNKPLTEISLSRTATPVDIVTCNVSNRLFVADKSGDCIWSVQPRTAQEMTKCVTRNWFVTRKFTNVTRPQSLSVRNGRLLVTSAHSSELLLLGPDPDDMSRVLLPNMLPIHAAETKNGTFVICHAVLGGCELCEVDADGSALRCYDCNASVKRLPSSALRCSPSRVTLDYAGRVYAVDGRNGRVLLLDAELKLRRVVLDENGPRKAKYACYVKHSGHLIAVDHSDEIGVYERF